MLDMDAAASIVLSPALQVLFDRLASPLLQKASDLFGYNDNFQSLQHALVRAQATLEVAEEQQFTNRAARLWLLDLKNAVCHTQDLLDFFTARKNWNHIFRLSISDDGIIKPEKLRIMLQELEMTITEGFRMFNIREPTQLLPGIVDQGDGEITIPLEALYAAEHLRTLLFLGDSGLSSNMEKMFSRFVYLRLLDLSGCGVSSFPDALGGLICLRYLDLSYTPIENLPRRTLPLYVAGRDNRLSELKQLNLHDKLNLTHLEKVRHAAEAKTAGLMMKKNLDSLGLYWGLYQPRSEDVDISLGIVPKRGKVFGIREQLAPSAAQQYKHAEEILDSLQPPKNMKKLFINGYPGFRFAAWALPEYVVAVEIANCQNCGHLPALGNLLLLKTLSLHGMHGVRRIGTEFYGDGADIRFPSLEKLSLSDFPNLEEWTSANSENSFPSLKKLTVKRCPKLAHIPSPQSLQHLKLQDCNPMLTSVANLGLLSVLVLENIPGLLTLPEGLTASACLSSLKILSCPKLRSLPLQIRNLTALKSLTIRCCEELSSLPQTLQNLKALESLEISNCHSIISMPDGWIGGLSSLRTLSIENCSNLTSLSSSLERLTLLEHLTIMFCPNLGSFPEGVQHLSSLRSLILLSCPWFDSLPEGLQHVRTLHCLKIGSCLNLTALPEWFEGLDSLRSLTIFDCPGLQQLPPGFKILTKLQHLSIQECPELEERCRQGSGEDWLKIAHVPHKYIGPPQARQSGEASTSGS
ncbi:hypothetical protein ACFXTO_044150 [Malus domestica]